MLKEMKLTVPTFDPDSEVEYDHSKPDTLTLREEDGLRVVMGEDCDAPDVLIERTPDRWRVFVHCDSGDPLCIIEFTDTQAIIETGDSRDKPLLVQERIVGASPRHLRGDIMPIFQKPLTREDYEGVARLEKFLATVDGMERWEVRFVIDGKPGQYEEQTHERLL